MLGSGETNRHKPRRLAALLFFTLCGVSPAAAQVQAKKPIVAVFNIEDKGAGLSRGLLIRLSDFMSMNLATTGKFQVVPRDQVKKRLVMQKRRSYRQCYDESCQIEIGKELSAQKSLTTMIMKLGSRCMVTTVLHDLRKAVSDGGASAEGGCSEKGIVQSIKVVVQKLTSGGGKLARRHHKGAAPAGHGGLFIKSLPSGAEVWLDGVKAKGATPLTLADLLAGDHLLQIRKGTRRFMGKAVVAPDKFTTISVALEQIRVRLQILSDPPEAEVWLDGKPRGKTPTILRVVAARRHALELRKARYLTAKRALRLDQGPPKQTVKVSLELAGYISTRSYPPGALVLVDGRTAGHTPVRLPVSPGKHVVRLEMTGRKVIQTAVQVKVGKDVLVSSALEWTESVKQQRSAAADRLQQEQQERAVAEARRRKSNIWAFTTLGVGVALSVGAAVLYGVGGDRGSEAHDGYVNTTDTDEIHDYRKQIRQARTELVVGHVLAVTGVAAIGASVYLILTRPPGPSAGKEPPSPRVGLAPAPGGATFFLGGRF